MYFLISLFIVAIFAARFFSSATQLSIANALATINGSDVGPGFIRPSRWGSGFFQFEFLATAKIPRPLGPAQEVESHRAVLQFSGNLIRVPDAVASTKIPATFSGRPSWIVPVSRLQSCKQTTSLRFRLVKLTWPILEDSKLSEEWFSEIAKTSIRSMLLNTNRLSGDIKPVIPRWNPRFGSPRKLISSPRIPRWLANVSFASFKRMAALFESTPNFVGSGQAASKMCGSAIRAASWRGGSD